jgi:LemA protein
MDPVTIVIIAIAGLLLAWLIYAYNRLVVLRNRIDASWAQIEVQLKRRYDLIPNLVETVRGYASHERETLEGVTRARQQAIEAGEMGDQSAAENALTQMLRQLFALSEAYPDLKADQNFRALQEELTGTESRIAFARQFYNEQVLRYDNSLETFPSNIVGRLFRFRPKPYFEGETVTGQPVTVDFTRTR